MFYLLGIVIAVIGVIWLINGAVLPGALVILLGLFVAGYIGGNARR